ncbi:SseB family protein [Microbacterium sp. NPDC091313]
MALFSRRKKSDSADTAADGAPDERQDGVVEPGEQPVTPDAGDPAPRDASAVEAHAAAAKAPGDAPASPQVGISVSSFQGVGAPAGAPTAAPPTEAGEQPAGAAFGAAASGAASAGAAASGAAAPEPVRRLAPAEAPAPRESVPGLQDNVLLADALAALSATPTGPELMNVARQLLQGHLFLRVQGDARALLSEGKPVPLSVASHGDDRYVLVFSSGAAIRASVQADGDANTSAMGQPVLPVLRHVLEGDFAGLILDNNSAPARAIMPRQILERAVGEADDRLLIKSLLAAPRTDATASEVAAALTEVPVWIAVKSSEEGGPIGVAESRTTTGERYLEIYSHPLESVALARGDAAAPVTTAQLATAIARDAGLAGVFVNPGGPSIRLTRDDLAPLLALAE